MTSIWARIRGRGPHAKATSASKNDAQPQAAAGEAASASETPLSPFTRVHYTVANQYCYSLEADAQTREVALNAAYFDIKKAAPRPPVGIEEVLVDPDRNVNSLIASFELDSTTAANEFAQTVTHILQQAGFRQHQEETITDDTSESAGKVKDLSQLGIFHYRNLDYRQAFECLKFAAARGDSQAQAYLGIIYDNGHGLPRNHEEAFKWFRQSAFCLGVMYRDGRGVVQDYKQAGKWIALAARKGNSHAEYNLGTMYYHGLGVPQSLDRAAWWWGKAADKGIPEAKHNLAAIRQQLGLE